MATSFGRAVTTIHPAEIAMVKDSTGAGSTGFRWLGSAEPKVKQTKYIVCNADENQELQRPSDHGGDPHGIERYGNRRLCGRCGRGIIIRGEYQLSTNA